ncbi:MAG: hypothetical protein FWH22_05865 [Fibromonadales bacterium]|nr:hypothetical protein [Fibromonadales bacterium]
MTQNNSLSEPEFTEFAGFTEYPGNPKILRIVVQTIIATFLTIATGIAVHIWF